MQHDNKTLHVCKNHAMSSVSVGAQKCSEADRRGHFRVRVCANFLVLGTL